MGDHVATQRIVFGLFGKTAPKAVENFRALANCDRTAPISGKPACYKGSTFHRVITDFMIQGGDFTNGDGTGGESIFGERFSDESFEVKFNRPLMLAMSNTGRNSNGSQFFVTTVKTQWLDGKHVIFGMVVDGEKAVKKIEKTGTYGGKPKEVSTIVNCGEAPLEPEDKEVHY
jgi:peptidylprolyl isomerase